MTSFEKETGILITADFPLMRYQQMLDDIRIMQKREQKEIDKSKRKGRRK